MRKAFTVLRERPRISVCLTRDSLSAGDDGDAPHEKTIEIYSFIDPIQLFQEASLGYLPTLAGAGESWVCILNDVRIATLEGNEIRALVKENEFNAENKIHFEYKSA